MILARLTLESSTIRTYETKRDRYGVSAQKLQEIAPEMVYEDTDEDRTLRVGYIDFLLAKAANQDKEVAELKDMIYRLMEA